MESLQEIRSFDFSGYDNGKVNSTKENIKDLQEDTETVWNMWIDGGLTTNEEFEIDFEFYAANKESAHLFAELLLDDEYEVVLTFKRSFLIFKGYEIQASFKGLWNIQKLKDTIEQLGLVARKHNVMLEGFGGLVKNKQAQQIIAI